MATATLPTPPAAPVTSTSPMPGLRPCASSAATAIIAVKPAVPIAIARLVESAAGSFTSIAASLRLADAPAGQHDLVAGLELGRVRALDRAGEIDAGDVRVLAHQAAE